jgi:hypothetical protein
MLHWALSETVGDIQTGIKGNGDSGIRPLRGLEGRAGQGSLAQLDLKGLTYWRAHKTRSFLSSIIKTVLPLHKERYTFFHARSQENSCLLSDTSLNLPVTHACNSRSSALSSPFILTAVEFLQQTQHNWNSCSQFHSTITESNPIWNFRKLWIYNSRFPHHLTSAMQTTAGVIWAN